MGTNTEPVTDLPRHQGQIQFEQNRDHPGNFDLVTSRTPYQGGGWTLCNRTEFSMGDLIELAARLHDLIADGKAAPQS